MFHDHRRWSLEHVAFGSTDAVRTAKILPGQIAEKPKFVRPSSLFTIVMLAVLAWVPVAIAIWQLWPA